jgi:hypothetical protein
MPRRAKPHFEEKKLSKGELRKLNALRKSLGEEIADRAFSEWLAERPDVGVAGDRNAEKITDALNKLVVEGDVRIPRGGYILRRGRGRVIVERPE